MSTEIRDIEFVRRPTRPLKLDLYLPDKAETPPAIVVWITGGGWNAGSKHPCPAQYLTDHGFAVASIEYRYSSETIFPGAVEDCHAAVCWLRRHAAEHGFDGGRIGLIGASAGGHLAALLGTSGLLRNWSDPAGDPAAGRVQAVVDACGPTLLTRAAWPELQRRYPGHCDAVRRFLGGAVPERLGAARDASPVTYAHPLCPPFLILHGRKDELVPIEEGLLLRDALFAAGANVAFEAVAEDGHEFKQPYVPIMIKEFFRRTLIA